MQRPGVDPAEKGGRISEPKLPQQGRTRLAPNPVVAVYDNQRVIGRVDLSSPRDQLIEGDEPTPR